MYCVDSSLNGSGKWITLQVWHGFQSCLFADVRIHTYIYKFVCVHVCACICVCVCVQINIDIYVEYIKNFLGPIPSKKILLLNGLANVSGNPCSDKKLQKQGFVKNDSL